MVALTNKRKLAALSKETQEEQPQNSQSQNTSVTEEYITQVSEAIKVRFTMKPSQEVNTTDSRILGALSKLYDILLNLQAPKFSATVLGTTRNTDLGNREPTGDQSQSDPHPEVELSNRSISNSTDSDPEETSHSACVQFLQSFFMLISTDHNLFLGL